VTTSIKQVHLLDVHHGIVALVIAAEGIWSYQFNRTRLHAFARLVAGKSAREAEALLMRTQGVRAVSIELAGRKSTVLPVNPEEITVRLLVATGL
jgi:VCBS repeat-containing protein